MIETRAATHPLYDPASLYQRMCPRTSLGSKMHGFFHSTWSHAEYDGLPLPAATARTREELAALSLRVGDGAEVVDAARIRWRLVDGGLSEGAELCLVREADGKMAATLLLPPLRLGVGPCRCRAFLLRTTTVARLQDAVGGRPWQDAFRAEVLADNFKASQALTAAAEFEGEWRPGEGAIRFVRVPAPEAYSVLPPLQAEMQAAVFLDTHEAGANGAVTTSGG